MSIKKGDIVVNASRQWIGVFKSWNFLQRNCRWSFAINSFGKIKTLEGHETISSALPATKEEKLKFRKILKENGYTYCRGIVTKEL